MKASPLTRTSRTGMTLIEMTVVILVLLSLIAVLLIGAAAWKAGSDRAFCLLNIRNVQLAARSYQNLYIVRDGENFEQGLIIGADKALTNTPTCPARGNYTYATTFPTIGNLVLDCDISDHEPIPHDAW